MKSVTTDCESSWAWPWFHTLYTWWCDLLMRFIAVITDFVTWFVYLDGAAYSFSLACIYNYLDLELLQIIMFPTLHVTLSSGLYMRAIKIWPIFKVGDKNNLQTTENLQRTSLKKKFTSIISSRLHPLLSAIHHAQHILYICLLKNFLGALLIKCSTP